MRRLIYEFLLKHSLADADAAQRSFPKIPRTCQTSYSYPQSCAQHRANGVKGQHIIAESCFITMCKRQQPRVRRHLIRAVKFSKCR